MDGTTVAPKNLLPQQSSSSAPFLFRGEDWISLFFASGSNAAAAAAVCPLQIAAHGGEKKPENCTK